jgi:predicted amidohydrolase
MRVAACQLDAAWEDKRANFAKARALLAGAGLPPGAFAALPEMFATGFSMNAAGIAEREGGETEAFLSGLARELGIFLAGGVAREGRGGKGRNEAVVFGPDGTLRARYAKMHPFSYGGEDRHYEAGEDVTVFEVGGLRGALFICYDLRFPEVFRRAVRRGADFLVVIASWPDARQAHWRTLLEARAIENQAFVLGVNRTGRDPRHAYAGGSRLLDPQGRPLFEAGSGEGVFGAEIDPAAAAAWRREFPALRDARPGL